MVALCLGGEVKLYAIRDRQHLWESLPGAAIRGIAMHPLQISVLASTLATAQLFSWI
jgi:hypothetical protein